MIESLRRDQDVLRVVPFDPVEFGPQLIGTPLAQGNNQLPVAGFGVRGTPRDRIGYAMVSQPLACRVESKLQIGGAGFMWANMNEIPGHPCILETSDGSLYALLDSCRSFRSESDTRFHDEWDFSR